METLAEAQSSLDITWGRAYMYSITFFVLSAEYSLLIVIKVYLKEEINYGDNIVNRSSGIVCQAWYCQQQDNSKQPDSIQLLLTTTLWGGLKLKQSRKLNLLCSNGL